MYEATLHLGNDSDLKKIFDLEDKVFANKRASYEVFYEQGLVKIKAKATDSVALRSVLNTITKILGVYEKALKLAKN